MIYNFESKSYSWKFTYKCGDLKINNITLIKRTIFVKTIYYWFLFEWVAWITCWLASWRSAKQRPSPVAMSMLCKISKKEFDLALCCSSALGSFGTASLEDMILGRQTNGGEEKTINYQGNFGTQVVFKNCQSLH